MRGLSCLLVLVVVGAGCTTLPSPPPATPEPLPSGPRFDDVQWEEPSAPLADHVTAQATSEWNLRVTGRPGAVDQVTFTALAPQGGAAWRSMPGACA